MATAVAKKKSAELSTDVLDDIFEYTGEGTAYEIGVRLVGSEMCIRDSFFSLQLR